MKEQNIEQLFKDALSNLEADVSPNSWANIEQGLKSPVGGNHLAGNAASAVKSAGFLGKLGLNGWLLAAVGVSVIGTAVYLSAKKSETPVQPATTVVQQSQSVVSSPEKSSATNEAVKTEPQPVVENRTGVAASHESQPEKKMTGVPVEHQATMPQQVDVASPSASAASPSSNSQSTEPAQKNTTNNSAPASAIPHKPTSVAPVNSSEPDKFEETAKQNDAVENDPVFDSNIENYLVSDGIDNPKLPNIFTPNNDNTNDKFKIKTVNLVSMEVAIFNMKGDKVYSWKSLSGEWDGKLVNGADAPEGRYFYTLNGETSEGKICIAQSPLWLKRSLK